MGYFQVLEEWEAYLTNTDELSTIEKLLILDRLSDVDFCMHVSIQSFKIREFQRIAANILSEASLETLSECMEDEALNDHFSELILDHLITKIKKSDSEELIQFYENCIGKDDWVAFEGDEVDKLLMATFIMDRFAKEVKQLKGVGKSLKEENENLKGQVDELTEEIDELERQKEQLEKKCQAFDQDRRRSAIKKRKYDLKQTIVILS